MTSVNLRGGHPISINRFVHWVPLPEAIAGLAIATHAFFAWGHMHGQVSVLDEGLYLYKGWLFATGRFAPFQDFGPLTNHMPLSFLIPGWFQLLFGPGIRSGRTMAFALGLVMLLGLWILGRRLAGRWWAALPLWLVALNPFLTKIYAQAISQVLVAAILVWVLVLALGEKRPTWQLVTGSALAAVCALVRINLMPLPLLLVPYLFWQHGRRTGIYSLLAVAGVILLGHAIYWPGILKLWAFWIPRDVTPFLDTWREPLDSIAVWNPQYGIDTRWGVFKDGLRRHLAATLGIAAGLLMWLRLRAEEKWSSTSRMGVFMVILFLALLVEHTWAALGNNYCVFCFQSYMAFFSAIGLLVGLLAIRHWLPRLSRAYALGVLAASLGLAMMLGRQDFERMSEVLLLTQVPRIKQLSLRPGTSQLYAMLEAKFGLAPELGLRILTFLLFLWAIVLLALLTFAAYRLLRDAFGRPIPGWLMPVLFALLIVWTIANGLVVGTRFRTYDCGGDVIAAMESAGSHLGATLEPGSTIYWLGSLSPVPLIYASGAEVFPPQLNRVYSLRVSQRDKDLARLGLWNAALDEQWLKEADYLLVAEEYHGPKIADALGGSEFEERLPTPPTDPCRPETAIHIYRRIQ